MTDAHLIGRMILARWLDYPPSHYEKLVETITASQNYQQMAGQIAVVHLPATRPLTDGADDTCAVARLVPQHKGRMTPLWEIAYRHPAWGKEFRVDDRVPTTGNPADPEADWLLRRLRLINTRNRLTHLILLSVLEVQAAFLHSGAWANLDPLSLTALTHRLADGSLPPGLETLDVSIVSRTARDLTVSTPQGNDLPLRRLLPSTQAVLRYRLQALLGDELTALKRGELERPRNDEELRRQVQARWGQQVSRRTVASTRQSLGIAAWRRRASRPVYPPPGFNFSSPRSLTPDTVRAHAPAGPGVYEIASKDEEFHYPFRASSLIYLGRSRNLYRRLRAHLHNHEKFGPQVAEGRLVFRFATVYAAQLREAEVELVRAFCEAYGALPCYNVVIPSGGAQWKAKLS